MKFQEIFLKFEAFRKSKIIFKEVLKKSEENLGETVKELRKISKQLLYKYFKVSSAWFDL